MVTIFIISSHLMFGRGLENLLRREKEIKILGHETNVQRAIDQIKILNPEVVIIYGDEIHTSSIAIIDVLKATPKTKVIGLNLQNNAFFVYQAMEGVTTKLEDLLKAIFTNHTFQENNHEYHNNPWGEANEPSPQPMPG